MKWILNLFRRRRIHRELAEEVESHIQEKVADLIESGMSEQEARQKARREFGNATLYAEIMRETWGWMRLERFGQDLRHGLRLIGRSPGFASVAIITLALGIGANTTIFSLVNALVLRPLRLEAPDRLVVIRETNVKQGGQRDPTAASYAEWSRFNQTFQDIGRGNLDGAPETLSGLGRAERVSMDSCTANFFSLLGVQPFRGRTFLPEDAPQREGATLVISHALWQRSFAADPKILGQTVSIGGNPKIIVGVLPPGFSLLPWDMKVDAWLAYQPAANPRSRWLTTIGRLKPGITIEQAQAELNAMVRRPEADPDWTVRLQPLHESVVGGSRRRFLYLLLGAVGFVLLLACANVANLLLARAAARQREMAVRASLGAGRFRLVRQLLAESLLLALLGGALGVLVGVWGIRILLALGLFGFDDALTVNIDTRVLGFTLGISVLSAVLFGLVPAFRASKPDLNESLKEGGRSSAGLHHRTQGLLLVSQVALAVVLLVGAGLMMNSFLRLQRDDLGFNPKNVLRADIFLNGPQYWQQLPGDMKRVTPQGAVFFQQVLERIEALPGVVSASISHLAPPGRVLPRALRIVGRPAPPPGRQARAGYNEVSAGFFRTLQIPLLKGRHLTERDAEGSPWVIVINETMARRFFPNEDPIGKLVQVKILGSASNVTVDEDRPREIVGVVGDVRHFGFGAAPFPIMYGSYRQRVSDYPGGFYSGHLWKSITIRAVSDPLSLAAAVQKVVAEVDKDQALFDIMSIEQGLSQSLSSRRFTTRLFGIFGGLALFLAAVGIYGVMSYLVSRRAREMGVRLALGASRGDVLKLIIGRGLKTTMLGLALGIAGSLALTRLIAGFLYQVKTTDPLTYLIVALVLAAVAVAACYLPARRATSVDPLIALRHE